MINLLWGIFVIISATIQWYIIAKQRRRPDKVFWFGIRIYVAALFMYMYIDNGYLWYWSLLFMMGSFWWPFNTILMLARGVPLRFLGDDWVDRALLKITNKTDLIFYFSLIFCIITVGCQIFYGKISILNLL